MSTLKNGIEACLSPVGIMTLLFIAGLVMSVDRRTSRIGRRCLSAGSCLYLVFLFSPLAAILIASLERPFPSMRLPDTASSVRAIVVLGGYGRDRSSLPPTSKLSTETLARMVEGIRLSRALPGAKLVLSGGVAGRGGRPVARLMADVAIIMGVPERDIVIEGKSATTYENLVEVKTKIGSEPFFLVTSACDLRRAAAVASKLGMKPVAAPAAIWAAQNYPAGMSWSDWLWTVVGDVAAPSTLRFAYIQRAYHEYLGYVWYWMLGRVG